MLHVKTLDEGLEIFKALGSELRISIVKLLLNNKGMNMNELASSLNITNGALTSHIKKLEDCGIVTIVSESAGHGNQKKCMVHLDKILVEFNLSESNKNIYQTEINVGHYSNYEVYPTCGLASASSLIGEVDDPRYFAHPDRISSEILWFTRGYVEYLIPNFLPASQKIDQITISAELSSEAPGTNEFWPSDIHFYLNNVCLGSWISPGDFGDIKGLFTPDWWYPNWNQYGLLKSVMVNHQGSYVDGLQISNITLEDLHLDFKNPIKFKLGVPDDADHIGGLTIFGKGFGNYNQNIQVRISYSPIEEV